MIFLSHKIGNPNAQMHLLITNVGGRSVKIKAIDVLVRREDDGEEFRLPVQSFLVNPGDKEAALLPAFNLKPNDEWSHVVNCLEFFSRTEQREYGQLESQVRADISAKKRLPEFRDELVETDPELVSALHRLFERKLKWRAGEYTFTITVNAEPAKARVRKAYYAILFEYDSETLREHADHFKYGAGIYYQPDHLRGVFVHIRERSER